MFKKIVAIEPTYMLPAYVDKLYTLASEVVLFNDTPHSDEEVARRIADADAVLLSFTSRLTRSAMEKCPDIKYIGMCCSLYSKESANVDIDYAQSRGITVKGIRDYGDDGVVEFIVSEIVRIFHGFGQEPWYGRPKEINGTKVGILGLGKTGGMIADAMKFFGAEISYVARSEKEEARAKGYKFLPIKELLSQSEIIFCCLNKNTVLMHEEEISALGDHKIIFNTGMSPAWDEEPMLKWLDSGENLIVCDTLMALGRKELLSRKDVRCPNVSTGMTIQAYERLSEKVLDNIRTYMESGGK